LLNSSKNSALKVRLEQEKVVTLSLLKLQDKVFYLKLSNAKSKKIIQRTYQRTKNKSIHIQSNNQIVLSGFSMPFSDVLNGLNRLKNKYNIVVVDADILVCSMVGLCIFANTLSVNCTQI
jgi:type II secretory pathway component PulM